MQWVWLLSQVLATVAITIPLLRVSWKDENGPFSYVGASWKMVLFAVFVWLLSMSFCTLLHRGIIAYWGVPAEPAVDWGSREEDRKLPWGAVSQKIGKKRTLPFPVKKGN